MGSMELQDDSWRTDGSGRVLEGFVRNQGDAGVSPDYLERVLSQLEFLPSGMEVDHADMNVVYLALAETLGRRSPSCIRHSPCR